MGGKPSKAACEIRGVGIIGVENPSHSVQIIMKFTIIVGARSPRPTGWETQPLQVAAQPPAVSRFSGIGCWVSRFPFNPTYEMSNVNMP